jgi:site-specific DNA-methyltransferase (adenine-specific)
MEATLDLWRIPSESARRVGHPAPFPVELPLRLIELYTYAGDLVLDPFLGSGSTAVAAVRSGRRHVGYDIDSTYIEIAGERIARELEAGEQDGSRRYAADQGKTAAAIAEDVLTEAGFQITARSYRVPTQGLAVPFVAEDKLGGRWYFDLSGAFTTTRSGLLRSEEMWKALGRAHVLAAHEISPLVLLTTHLPPRDTEGDKALRSVGPRGFFDAVELLSEKGRERLRLYAQEGRDQPVPGFWTGAADDSQTGS